jgi:hypothetical protein
MTTLFFGLLFGAVGGVYLAWGKRQHEAAWLAAGVALILDPYFVDGALPTFAIGALLIAAPFLWRRFAG